MPSFQRLTSCAVCAPSPSGRRTRIVHPACHSRQNHAPFYEFARASRRISATLCSLGRQAMSQVKHRLQCAYGQAALEAVRDWGQLLGREPEVLLIFEAVCWLTMGQNQVSIFVLSANSVRAPPDPVQTPISSTIYTQLHRQRREK